MPYDGVFENNFILQERLDEARTNSQDICVAFLDFANAFGSVPHNALMDAVQGAGVGDHFREIVQELYTDNTTVIVGGEGTTAPVRIESGIRQGCPLSGLLFNLVIDPIVRAIQGGSGRHNILAFADDLTPIADDPDALQQRINTIDTQSTQLGLKLKPTKCMTLHLSGNTPWVPDPPPSSSTTSPCRT